ncbi:MULTISPECIES: transporter substrate-binding domain-containing protein [Aminobacterium]|jgi:polar amino acid transport system substrate-binding protein|uniref:transporter substrate-binding domain-containing protein n=1 Tax=Aminobacterium TaxID=81466 RepID=UPI000465E239|nr:MULTISPECIES: transporter substrate-binding domain-containing protein [Aminobacterium]
MKKNSWVFVLLVTVVVLWGGFAQAASVMEKDTIVAGTSGSYPPFEFHDKTGALVGFDIDLANEVGKRLGKKVEWVDMAFDGVIPSLLTGKIDMIAAALSITEERSKKVAFSQPYMVSLSAFVLPTNSPDVNGMEDLKGKSVAVQLATTQDVFISEVADVTVKRFPKLNDAVREVALKRADASLMDETVAETYINSEEFKGQLKKSFTVELKGAKQALAVSQEEPLFLEAINEVLTKLDEEGFIAELHKKWNTKKE